MSKDETRNDKKITKIKKKLNLQK